MRTLITLIACTLFLVSCSAAPQEDHIREQVLRLNIHSEPPTLDPGLAADTVSVLVLDMLFDGLTRIGPNGNPDFAVAETVDVSPDGKRYTFRLRRTTWSDGTPLTAHDFVYAWKRALTPSFPGPYAYLFYGISGARAAKEGKAPLDAIGIRAEDDYTLSIQLDYPQPYFLEMVSLQCFLPVKEAIVAQDANWAYEAGPHYISNGPFTLKSWKHSNEIVVVRNPLYWDSQAVKLNKIVISMIEDTNTELALFQKGALDWAGKPVSVGLPTDAINHLKSSGQLEIQPIGATYFFELNVTKPPLNNVKFRKALAYAINRQAIVDNITQTDETPAKGFIPLPLRTSAQEYFKDNDLSEARRLLEEALTELGLTRQSLPRLAISYNTSEGHHKIAQAIQQQWRDVLGLTVELENFEWKVYLDKLSQHDFMIGRMGWQAAYRDPIDFLELVKLRNSALNHSGWEDPDYAALLNEARITLDPETRKALLQKAEARLMEQMPLIPIYFTTNSYLQNPRLRGVMLSPLGFVDFKRAFFE